MKKAVILKSAGIISPLGELGSSVSRLVCGESALQPGTFFGVETAIAPFSDLRFRNAAYAASQLAKDIPLGPEEQEKTVFLNSSAKGDIHCLENVVTDTSAQIDINPLLDSQAQVAARSLGLNPAHMLSISNACASGAIAVEVACEHLESRRYGHAVIFGIESICKFVATGFNALSALSATGARPFDARRDGLSLGEATAVAVLSYCEPQKGDIIVAGAGSSNDANHRTGPSRTGDGLHRAARAALADAGMEPEEIGAVKCHGTATVYNDAMEAKALHSLFGDSYPPCASFKGALGHTSGAGSLVEMLIAAQCLLRRTLPPTARFEQHGVDENVPISNTKQAIEKPAMLCLSAGFGGVNAAVVIKEALA